MAVMVEKRIPEVAPAASVSSVPAARTTAPISPTEQTPPAYSGDVALFLFWAGCTAVLAGMIIYETVAGLVFGR